MRAHQLGQPGAAVGLADARQHRLQRGGAELLDRRLVHEAAVDRGDPGAVAAAGRIAQGVALDQRPHPRLGQVAQHPEGTVAGLVGRDGGVPGPVAVGVGEEVLARRDLAVHAGGVDAPAAVAGGGDGVPAAAAAGLGAVEQQFQGAGLVGAGVGLMGAGLGGETEGKQGRGGKQGLLQGGLHGRDGLPA